MTEDNQAEEAFIQLGFATDLKLYRNFCKELLVVRKIRSKELSNALDVIKKEMMKARMKWAKDIEAENNPSK